MDAAITFLGEKAKPQVSFAKVRRMEQWINKAIAALTPYEFESFLVGVTGESQTAKTLKREVGKGISERLTKSVDFLHPDLVVILDTPSGEVNIQANPVYVYGRYRKLARGIPQTRWPCRKCRGAGCAYCKFTGKMYAESVEEIIRDAAAPEFEAVDMILHASGREDIDALILGGGRPFVAKFISPRKRKVDLPSLEKKIGKQGKVEALDLRYAEPGEVKTIKMARGNKTYRLRLKVEGGVSEAELKDALDSLQGIKIKQRTPSRVAHRRADKERERRIYEARLVSFPERTVEVKCEAGTYVKELVSGDGGRTRPSLREKLGTEVGVDELDVLGVEL